ncbi:MAG: hypothetical protein CL707_08885 [Chloroflexi bacterium]|nr:hypothetical protein [Chloroflexota bacterium]
MVRYRWIMLLLVPLIDIFLLIRVAEMVGLFVTASIVIITAFIGLLLVRSEGAHTIRKLLGKLENQESPTNQIIDGILIIVAGVCLLTPGLVTDLIGFILVLPPTRYPIRLGLKGWAEKMIQNKSSFGDNIYVIKKGERKDQY